MLETLLIIITKWSPSSYHNWIMMQDEIQKFKFDNNPLVNSIKKNVIWSVQMLQILVLTRSFIT